MRRDERALREVSRTMLPSTVLLHFRGIELKIQYNLAQGNQTGRILPHQRDTNDVTPIINGGTAINAEHTEAIQHTQAKEMVDTTRREHRRRTRHLHGGRRNILTTLKMGLVPLVMTRRRILYDSIILMIGISSTKG